MRRGREKEKSIESLPASSFFLFLSFSASPSYVSFESAEEWFAGQIKPPQLKSLKPANLTALSQAGPDTAAKGRRAEAPVATEKEIGREDVNAALFKQVGTHKEGTQTREWQTGGGVAANEWDE